MTIPFHIFIFSPDVHLWCDRTMEQ